jgi:peptidoglycan hydrolase-like protein with peptidoglycan-binding domain
MAYTMKLGFSDLHTIYNLTYAVGLGQVNRRDDVLLVQTLLKMAHAMILGGGVPSGSTSTITVDGYFGPETKLCIDAYQKEQTYFYHKLIAQDGIISPSTPDGYTKKGNLYTIVHLNRSALTHDSSQYRYLPFSTDTPPELRNALAPGAVKPKPSVIF